MGLQSEEVGGATLRTASPHSERSALPTSAPLRTLYAQPQRPGDALRPRRHMIVHSEHALARSERQEPRADAHSDALCLTVTVLYSSLHTLTQATLQPPSLSLCCVYITI